MKAHGVVDVFCGAGGLSEGLREAGFEILLGIDSDPNAVETFSLNFGEGRGLLADLRELRARDITSRIKKSGYRKVDVLVGGPPCQGFSTLGDKLSSDPRNNLFGEFARLVGELKPKCVLVENVKALTTMYGGQFRDHFITALSNLGYVVYQDLHNAADFGVPQKRNRVFFFATRLEKPFATPKPTHGKGKNLLPHEVVGKYISDLSDPDVKISNHLPLNHSKRVVERYRLIPEGGKLPPPEALPREIRRKNFGSTYKRLHRRKPAVTLVPGNNAFPIHPWLDRSLTPREAARLQTFPDRFVFMGDRRKQCILVGNAVPPLLAKRWGESIINHLENGVHKNNGSVPVNSSNTPAKAGNIIPPRVFSKTKNDQGFIDLFSGAGGFAVGIGRSGWKPLLFVDNNSSVAMTHKHNFPSIPFIGGDLSRKNVKNDIVKRFEGSEVGMIVGGPPCQGFSIFGNRRFVKTRGYDSQSDPRNRLVFSFIELVQKIRPRWFVMENVPGFENIGGGKFLEGVINKLKKCGYPNSEARVLNAADFGVPQKRKRLIIIGNRTGHIIPWPKKKFFEKPKEWQKPYRVVGEAISDLAEGSSYSRHTCHVPMNHKPLLKERYKLIPEGGRLDVDSLPPHLRKGYRTKRVKNYSHIYKRLHRRKPASTMVPGHNAFPVHPWLNRTLTVREAARIQTFPDEMKFCGTRQEQCIQAGNAFPPLLAELIGNNIIKAEKNGWFPRKVPPSAYYSLIERPVPLQKRLFNKPNKK